MGKPIPTSFAATQEPSYVDDNQFDYPPVTGGEFGRDILMGSPGGLASSAHHWTGGFYGKGGSSSDKFIGKKSNLYPSGEFGNLYSEKADEQLDDSFELLPYENIKMTEDDKPPAVILKAKKEKPTFFWALGFSILLVAIYIILSLWGSVGMVYIKKYFAGGKDLTTSGMLTVSLAGTVFLVLFSWLLGVSFLSVFTGGAIDRV